LPEVINEPAVYSANGSQNRVDEMVEIKVWVASFVARRREGQIFSIKQYRQR
jgi:hypothetical protein